MTKNHFEYGNDFSTKLSYKLLKEAINKILQSTVRYFTFALNCPLVRFITYNRIRFFGGWNTRDLFQIKRIMK